MKKRNKDFKDGKTENRMRMVKILTTGCKWYIRSMQVLWDHRDLYNSTL